MGNCQAVEAAALVIQHPSGKIERMYYPILACEVMKSNPGHYVSLIIPLPIAAAGECNSGEKTVRFTRVKLLRPGDTLVLGRAYRLVTTQDVMKVLRAKKYAKMKKKQTDAEDHSSTSNNVQVGNLVPEKDMKDEKQRSDGATSNNIVEASTSRSKSWRPSLDSIYESTWS